ncbi:nucleotidyltransferase family protein [Campylobacter sputorum]|uniref:nucleotidyltransferase family protein n=1 Tax=Campylobacter sputorum TaxID=206 RepID=UPI001F3EB2BB|nr:nucleotidyltransferase domain-containing protein [Campylobacter sputorum]ASM36672.1 nucleotidyl transferase domain protein [Campylobacter sputorum bv. faecalis CCUG 20703]
MTILKQINELLPVAKISKTPILTKDDILEYLSQIKPLLKKDGIKEIGLFGSYVIGEEEANSDVDLVVLAEKEFLDRLKGIDCILYFENLREKISKDLNKPVDLVKVFQKKN